MKCFEEKETSLAGTVYASNIISHFVGTIKQRKRLYEGSLQAEYSPLT